MNSANRRRMLNRRSAPRIMSLHQGVGISNAMTKEDPISIMKTEQKKDSFNRISLQAIEIVPTTQTFGSNVKPPNPGIRTTVDSSVIDASTPRIPVPNIAHPRLTIEGDMVPLKSEVTEQEKMPRVLYAEKGHRERKHLSSMINAGKQCELQAGYRQRWSLSEMYDEKKHQYPPSIHFSTNQIIRISFLGAAGGVLQDLEIGPLKDEISLVLPNRCKNIVVEGLGGMNFDVEPYLPRTAAYTSRFSQTGLPFIGFLRQSMIQQVGQFRYLGRGCFIEASNSKSRVNQSTTNVFRSGEILTGINDLRMFTSSKIETIAVFVRMEGDTPPSLHLALEGVVQVGEPVAVRRADALAYVWTVRPIPQFEGPSILDLRVDETTDIDGCIASIHPSTKMLEMIKESAWNKLVDNGPLSLDGGSLIRWEHDENVPLNPISHVPKDWTIPRRSKLQSISIKQKVMIDATVQIPQPKPAAVDVDSAASLGSDQDNFQADAIPDKLPLIRGPDSNVGEPYRYDVSTFIGDEDEDDAHTFSIHRGPSWLSMTEDGILAGTPSSEDAGTTVAVIRVTDRGGLSADARLEIEVIQKVLNRAPFWKPNVSVNPATSSEKVHAKSGKKESSQRRAESRGKESQELDGKTKSKQVKRPDDGRMKRRRRR